MSPRELGEIVRTARRSLGLRRDQLAGAAGVGVRFIVDVIARELTHALHPNHGARWKAVMARVMPDWRDRKAALKRALL